MYSKRRGRFKGNTKKSLRLYQDGSSQGGWFETVTAQSIYSNPSMWVGCRVSGDHAAAAEKSESILYLFATSWSNNSFNNLLACDIVAVSVIDYRYTHFQLNSFTHFAYFHYYSCINFEIYTLFIYLQLFLLT